MNISEWERHPERPRHYMSIKKIQQRPGMYIGPDLIQAIINSICEDIYLSGGKDLAVFRDEAHVVITADKDWMATDLDPMDMLFQRALIEIDDRRLASPWRAEAFVAALSAAYFTNGPAGQSSANMTYDDIPTEYREQIAGKTRFLIFDIRSPYFQQAPQAVPEL